MKNKSLLLILFLLVGFTKHSSADDSKLIAILSAVLEHQQARSDDYLSFEDQHAQDTISTVLPTAGSLSVSYASAIPGRTRINQKFDGATACSSLTAGGISSYRHETSKICTLTLSAKGRAKLKTLSDIMGEKEARRFFENLGQGWRLSQLLKAHLSPTAFREAEEGMALSWPAGERNFDMDLVSVKMLLLWLKGKAVDPALGKAMENLIREHQRSQPPPGNTETSEYFLRRMKDLLTSTPGATRGRGDASASRGHD